MRFLGFELVEKSDCLYNIYIKSRHTESCSLLFPFVVIFLNAIII